MPADRYHGQGLSPTGAEFPYLASDSLKRVVNIAIALERPLLVKGEPGCGKTKLAFAIAHELGLPEPHKWYVKSTSKAEDGLYTVDTLRRLHDAQLERDEARRLMPYVTFGPLGEALSTPGESVVLIDEIDKADPDFPNDLLYELEEKSFTIPGITKEDRDAGNKGKYTRVGEPIIVITSNDEKELPDAFLRRCIFHWIEFPEAKDLATIVQRNLPKLKWDATLLAQVVRRLREFREVPGTRKPPSTSELLDWVKILQRYGVKLEALQAEVKLHKLPYWEVLFKHQQDLRQVRQEGDA